LQASAILENTQNNQPEVLNIPDDPMTVFCDLHEQGMTTEGYEQLAVIFFLQVPVSFFLISLAKRANTLDCIEYLRLHVAPHRHEHRMAHASLQ